MTPNEKTLLANFIDELDNYFSAASCNDYELPVSDENIELVKAAYTNGGYDAASLEWATHVMDGNKLLVSNQAVLGELKRRLLA